MENTTVTEGDTTRTAGAWVWWLVGGLGLLGMCCAASLAVLGVLALVLTPALQTTTFDPSQFGLAPTTAQPPVAGVTATPDDGLAGISILTPAAFDYPQPHDNSVGDPNAPVKIVEFGDFQCPYCERFWSETEKSVIRNYVATGKVYLTYRSIVIIGPESKRAGEAAYCAADQGKFWEYHDFLFANQGQENGGTFVDRNLKAFARGVGLDQTKFGSCLSSEKYAPRVERDGLDAAQAGVKGTPAFLIDNQLVEGAQSYTELSHMIENLLNAPPPQFPSGQGQNGFQPLPGW